MRSFPFARFLSASALINKTVVPTAVVGAILAIVPAAPVWARQSDLPSQSQQPRDTNDQRAARAFNGRIEKSGHKLVLQETSTKAVYQLDDQDKAKPFVGKNVKVIATIDTASNTLHIVDIAPAKQ